jgi:hypothetical protein
MSNAETLHSSTMIFCLITAHKQWSQSTMD